MSDDFVPALHDLIPEASRSLKCDMNIIGQILNGCLAVDRTTQNTVTGVLPA